MFTGLVQTLGVVQGLSKGRLTLKTSITHPALGESIAINGVCLTVTKKQKSGRSWLLEFDLSPETLKKTNLSQLKSGNPVNVERCVTMSTLLGGHLVQGHVDDTGTVSEIRSLGSNKEITFKGPRSVLRYVVPKGSVTVNGVSLTAVHVTSGSFSVALIPHTLANTNLGNLKVGDPVNLEADVLAKYVEKLTKRS